MPTIIECPACATRYKMNKPIPEGGRYVKCARCGHQWRLVPESNDEADPETREDHGNSMSMPEPEPAQHHAAPDMASPDMASPDMASPDTASPDEYQAESWESRRDHFASTVSNMQDDAYEMGHDSDATMDRTALKNSWMDYDASGPAPGSATENTSFGDDDAGWAERMRRPWRQETQSAEPQPAEYEDPETAIRRALKDALENPGDVSATTSQGTADPFNDFWHGFSASEDLGFADKSPQAIAAQIDNVRRSSVIYDTNAARDGYSEREGAGDPAIQNDITMAFSEPVQRKPYSRPDPRHDTSLTDYDAGMHDAADTEGGDNFNTDFLNGDAAALQAELESFGQLPYEEPRRGGLALVAAWAVFLSIVSGVTLAIVNFRDNIMTAMPGTTHLYRTLGFDVADRRIEFGNVAYRWTMSGGKPMIEVKGQIINMTDHKVEVPRVLVNVRDAQTSDPVKANPRVRSEPLAARESAPFTLEIMPPSKTVSQIELEFDSTQ